MTSFISFYQQLRIILQMATLQLASVKQFKNELDVQNLNVQNVNPGKLQAIFIDKRKQDHTNEIFKSGHKIIKVASKVKLLGVEIDNKLNFKQYINCICNSAANQSNALIRLKRFLGFQGIKALVNSFVLSNFNHCTIARMYASSKPLTKIENLHKRTLRIMLDDYSSSYKRILEKSGKFSWVLKENKLSIEIYKTLNNSNPSFMKEIFELRLCSRPVRDQYKLNLNIPRKTQVTFGTKKLESLGIKIWNNFP